jgi:hypothetical protein
LVCEVLGAPSHLGTYLRCPSRQGQPHLPATCIPEKWDRLLLKLSEAPPKTLCKGRPMALWPPLSSLRHTRGQMVTPLKRLSKPKILVPGLTMTENTDGGRPAPAPCYCRSSVDTPRVSSFTVPDSSRVNTAVINRDYHVEKPVSGVWPEGVWFASSTTARVIRLARGGAGESEFRRGGERAMRRSASIGPDRENIEKIPGALLGAGAGVSTSALVRAQRPPALDTRLISRRPSNYGVPFDMVHPKGRSLGARKKQ